MGNKSKVNYTIQDIKDSFSYDPVTGCLARKKRNKGLQIRQDQETVCVFLHKQRVELSVNKVCYILGHNSFPSYKVRQIDKTTTNPLALNNLTTTPSSQPLAVQIRPNSKNTEKTRVVWRVGSKYAQRTLQTPSDACQFAKKKEKELKDEFMRVDI